MLNYTQQKGQALVLTIGVSLVLATAIVYLFNTSQILAERTNAKVLADHAAYNTAVKQAQLLNANAYMNKAKIANQLATAQAVSVASWAKHYEPVKDHTRWINIIPLYGPAIYSGIVQTTSTLSESADLPFHSININANNLATSNVSRMQNTLNNVAIAEIGKMPSKTVENSSIGSGFSAQPLPVATQWALNDSINGNFIKRYQGNSNNPEIGRQRLKDVVLASRDPFTRERRADKQWNLPSWARTFSKRKFQLHRRGGTEVSDDLNQWKAVDTMSLHYRQRKKFRRWRRREAEAGYGSALVRNDANDDDLRNEVGYSNVRKNKDASNRSHRFIPEWDARDSSQFRGSLNSGETGIPSFWDLDPEFLSQDEPTLPVAIKVSKGASTLDTTSGSSIFKVGEELNIISSDDAVAVSSAEVYFERPVQDRNGLNSFLNQSKREKASLLNPYWQVRLINNTSSAIAEANEL